jgi:arylamine N-acetyltransferase
MKRIQEDSTAMASFLNKKSKGKWNLTMRQMKERFGQYKRTYMEARIEDRAKGHHKLEHKRESKCHGYDRMEVLFGDKPNIEPLGRRDLGWWTV